MSWLSFINPWKQESKFGPVVYKVHRMIGLHPSPLPVCTSGLMRGWQLVGANVSQPIPNLTHGVHAALGPRTRTRFSISTPMAGYSEVPLIRHIASPDESLDSVKPDEGDLYTSHLLVLIDPCGAGENWRRTTIDVLHKDLLLEIFDFYRLDAMEESQGCPWKWHRLAHVCRKWRQVIFTSSRRLNLRILCKYGAPIGSILASWPTLPLVAKFNAGQKSKHIPRNVMVALRRPERLCEIDLHVTSSMLASIVKATQKPCQAMESIRITVEDPTGPSILVHSAFLGGSAPHLRQIKLDGVVFPFPAIRQVLLSTNNLVELHLSKIPSDAYFSPSDLVSGLSTLVQLKRLTIDFHSTASSPLPSTTRPPPGPSQCTTLPSLISLDFHGESGYVEEFLARIESPALRNFSIWLFNFNVDFFEIPQFCQLFHCLNVLSSPARAFVKHSVDFVGVDFVGVFFEEGKPLSKNCLLGTSCRKLDWQLSFVTQILSQLSPFLSSIYWLDILSDKELPATGEEDVDPAQWLEFFRPFTHVTHVYVCEILVPRIVKALGAEETTAEVLPELTSLHLSGYRRWPYVAKVAQLFVTTRRLSGRTVSLTSGNEVRH